jgi:hypothetical protein
MIPLALLQELEYYFCRSKRGAVGNSTYRSATGHVGSTHSENPVVGQAARVGDLRARPADIERCSQDPARVVVSGSSSARTAWLDQGQLGHVRQQSTREILRTDAQWTKATRSGDRQLEKADGSDHPDFRERVRALSC